MRRERMINEIAAAINKNKLTRKITPKEFNTLRLSMSSNALRRYFGTFNRAISLAFIKAKKFVEDDLARQEADEMEAKLEAQEKSDEAAEEFKKAESLKEAIEKAKKENNDTN